MPIYDYECAKCGKIEEKWAKMHESFTACSTCGGISNRIISRSNIICDLEPYFDENLASQGKNPQGQWVMSRQDRRRKMKELGLAEIG